MGTNTPRRGFFKPESGESGWGNNINNNFDILDFIGGNSFLRRKGATEGRWYAAGMNTNTALGATAAVANSLRALPLILPYLTTINALAINVTTASAGNASLGIYADDGNLYPSSLIVGAGEVGTGTTTITPLTVDIQRGNEIVWLVYVADSTPTMRSLAAGGGLSLLGVPSSLGTAPGIGWSVSFTYANLPATFPTGGAVLTGAQPTVFARLT